MPFPILDDSPDAVVHCVICGDMIEENQASTLYHVRSNDKAHLVHTKCSAANLARLVDAIGRHGTGRIGAALRLDR